MVQETDQSSALDSGQKSGGFQRLHVISIRLMQEIVRREFHSRNKEPRNVRASLTEREIFVVDFFEMLIQIVKAEDRIHQIRRLAGVAPRQHLCMDRMEYLLFFIGAYYQELYILESRITRWVRWIERRTDANLDRLKYKRIKEIIGKGFHAVREVRAAHVHERHHSTKELDWAAGLSLIARTRQLNDPELDMWESAATLKYRESRKKFIKRIDSDLGGISTLLDFIADEVFPILMAHSNQVRPNFDDAAFTIKPDGHSRRSRSD